MSDKKTWTPEYLHRMDTVAKDTIIMYPSFWMTNLMNIITLVLPTVVPSIDFYGGWQGRTLCTKEPNLNELHCKAQLADLGYQNCHKNCITIATCLRLT